MGDGEINKVFDNSDKLFRRFAIQRKNFYELSGSSKKRILGRYNKMEKKFYWYII